jgi:hypothetical protein
VFPFTHTPNRLKLTDGSSTSKLKRLEKALGVRTKLNYLKWYGTRFNNGLRMLMNESKM